MNSSLKLSLFSINLLLAGILLICAEVGVGLYFGGLGLLLSIIALFIGGKNPKDKDNK